MKPTKLHYFFAENWPAKIWLTAGSLLCATIVVRACHPTPALLKEWQSALWLVAVFLLALPVGFFCAILLGWFVLGPFYYDRSLQNGAPFLPGDRVRILAKPHRNRISKVYSLWQHDSVRVELGEQEKENFKDIFSPAQLLREPDDQLI